MKLSDVKHIIDGYFNNVDPREVVRRFEDLGYEFEPINNEEIMKKENAILFSTIDREDAWVCGGLVFKVEDMSTYEDSYNEIKSKLETEEVINYVIENRCLLDDLFNGDESFKFIKTYWSRGLYFVFENNDGEQVEYRMSADHVWVV